VAPLVGSANWCLSILVARETASGVGFWLSENPEETSLTRAVPLRRIRLRTVKPTDARSASFADGGLRSYDSGEIIDVVFRVNRRRRLWAGWRLLGLGLWSVAPSGRVLFSDAC
jgi:hypothetical protein